MSSSRQRTLVFVAACTGIIVLYLLHDTTRYRLPLSVPQRPILNTGSQEYRWNGYVEKFPVKTLISLPSRNAQPLPPIQHRFGTGAKPDSNSETRSRQQQVKDVFTKCWKYYSEKAWMHDELSPISGGARDPFGGWAATLVDALDTLWIMDLKDEFHKAAASATNISFSSSSDVTVNMFETAIRYLGGFLSAYDLSGDVELLRKAVEVGNMLLVAFDTPNRMPISRWNWREAADGGLQVAPEKISLAELGSFSLEFTRLSQLTADQRWFDAIQRITDLLESQQNRTKLPGMWPVVVNARDKILTEDTSFTLGGKSDSLYEYLPKEYALLGGSAPVYQKLYESSMSTAISHLLFRPMTPNDTDILLSGDAHVDNSAENQITLDPKGQHLTCFAGGMFGLGGRLFGNSEHVSIGQKLTDGCIWAYEAMKAEIMPEIAHFVPCPGPGDCSWDAAEWEKSVMRQATSADSKTTAEEVISTRKLPPGYTAIDDPRYYLRPEAIESVFILYRITGDSTYREAAWNMFTSISKATDAGFANAGIKDLTAIDANGSLPKDDRMQSFWLAETLKYFYLIFSDPELISLDDWVLNTEAHPLRRPQ
ncbi:MAG: hypothetical protein Q9227_007895 [Pyrenula ochraceoflavens]